MGISNNDRRLSIDFFRGITMFLLIGEFTGLFEILLISSEEGNIFHFVGFQLHHHPWNGLRFWDLVQPFFTFIVGVSIPFSVNKRRLHGDSEGQLLKHAIKRSIILLFLGWALYCIDPGRITFRFQNVLAQLSVSYIIAFLIKDKSVNFQLIISFGLILFAELLFRFFWIPGFDQPFTPDQNFGAWFDLLISGELSSGHWVSFNAISTTAHTIWGVLTAKLIMSDRDDTKKFKIMIIAGIILFVSGYTLDPLTPIIKRIATSSFVIASGGWTLIAMALSFWFIDIKRYDKWVWVFAVVGMNPLFIYLFAHVGGARFIEPILHPFTYALFSWTGEHIAEIITALLVWTVLWYMCYWLYKRKIFIKI